MLPAAADLSLTVRPGGNLRAVDHAGGVHLAVARAAALVRVPPLPADRRAAGHLPAWRAERYLAARALLRSLLADAVGADTAREPLAARPGGRPYLPGSPGTAVSLSGSEGWVAAAVLHAPGDARAVVGVDVQSPYRPSAGLVRRCCRGEAPGLLAALPESVRAREFAWIWTVQEACVKAEGTGLAGRPWTVPVAPGARHGQWRGLCWRSLRAVSPVPLSYARGPADLVSAADRTAPHRSTSDAKGDLP
ncbi:4'-phosphopantetheinyl transferase family protein [Streptomyces carminius]|uniref:4'-phosphopantetheinyl transferase family protein n=1 Tax=Streptomyces carminius TaxID=2665496 RepID=UPI001E46DB95|nr:4'-phosphopantetheinyl transferase superfamily protein [Streptomyces carminius]